MSAPACSKETAVSRIGTGVHDGCESGRREPEPRERPGPDDMATHSDVPEGGRAGDPTSDESEKDRLDVGRVVAEQVATEPHPARDEKPHAAGHQMERECRDSTSSASTCRCSGARSSTIASIVGKPWIERAASVRTGPADTALTRMFFSPRSHARYWTDESSAALATPITL